MEFDEKLMKRIWLHIDKTDTCWLSKYAIEKTGYSLIRINHINYRFHRVMLFWNDQSQSSKFSEGKNWLACHTCTNKHCVNPNHLYWGTQNDNMRDKIKDGTDCRGQKSVLSKLTDEQVLEIREKHSKKVNKNDNKISTFTLAKEYGVKPSTIGMIICRKTWSHLPQIPL
jgi:hypothetical protein